MLDQSTRAAILRLREEGHGARRIARALGVSRNSVKRVLAEGSAEIPHLARAEKAEPHRDEILELYVRCKGNLVRVHEELVEKGAPLSYPALPAFCRRHQLGRPPKLPAGQYHFAPGEEMQHDTSPHHVTIGGKLRSAQTASVVLCHSRMLFFQLYPRFTRFHCKVFLTDAARYFCAVCGRCMIDNTHVVVLSGTGPDMVPVPEMAAFADRLGFAWRAHKKGDANRSARVERPFHFIENNFLAGREFADWDDLNSQARAWCDRVNARHRRRLHASPRELFAAERVHMKPLPEWVPDVYQLHQRILDSEGYIHVHSNRYSAPWRLIGRRFEVRETKDHIHIFDGPREIAVHRRVPDPIGARVTDPAHRPPRGTGTSARRAAPAEEQELTRAGDDVVAYVALLKRRGGAPRDLRRLRRLLDEYPREPLVAALRIALHYGLLDLERLERLILRHVAGQFFTLPPDATAPEPPRDPAAAASSTEPSAPDAPAPDAPAPDSQPAPPSDTPPPTTPDGPPEDHDEEG